MHKKFLVVVLLCALLVSLALYLGLGGVYSEQQIEGSQAELLPTDSSNTIELVVSEPAIKVDRGEYKPQPLDVSKPKQSINANEVDNVVRDKKLASLIESRNEDLVQLSELYSDDLSDDAARDKLSTELKNNSEYKNQVLEKFKLEREMENFDD